MTNLTEEIKVQIDKKLQGIANFLLLNSESITNLGLVNGKMGVAIFFYQYSRYSNKLFYEEYAGELIDEIFNQIKKWAIYDFSNGLTGIGWGIEYLVKEGFLDADTDDILGDCDTAVGRGLLQTSVSLYNSTDLYSYGFYYLSRLSINNSKEDNLSSQIKKQKLVYLHDDCERLLTKENLFDFTLPVLSLKQINSIVYFLTKMQNLQIYPSKLEVLLNCLPEYLNKKMVDKTCDEVDLFTLSKLIEQLYNRTDFSLQNLYKDALANFSVKPSDEKDSLEEFIKVGWSAMIYGIDYCQSKNMNSLLYNTLLKLKEESSWNKLIKNQSNELTALGLSLLYLGNNKTVLAPIQE